MNRKLNKKGLAISGIALALPLLTTLYVYAQLYSTLMRFR
jgi:hypothetical protein